MGSKGNEVEKRDIKDIPQQDTSNLQDISEVCNALPDGKTWEEIVADLQDVNEIAEFLKL